METRDSNDKSILILKSTSGRDANRLNHENARFRIYIYIYIHIHQMSFSEKIWKTTYHPISYIYIYIHTHTKGTFFLENCISCIYIYIYTHTHTKWTFFSEIRISYIYIYIHTHQMTFCLKISIKSRKSRFRIHIYIYIYIYTHTHQMIILSQKFNRITKISISFIYVHIRQMIIFYSYFHSKIQKSRCPFSSTKHTFCKSKVAFSSMDSHVFQNKKALFHREKTPILECRSCTYIFINTRFPRSKRMFFQNPKAPFYRTKSFFSINARLCDFVKHAFPSMGIFFRGKWVSAILHMDMEI